jgi:DNA-binding MarR family transcriptional regulator
LTVTIDTKEMLKALHTLRTELDGELTLNQVVALVEVAVATEKGEPLEMLELQTRMHLPSATISRITSAFSELHWLKDRPGLDLIEQRLDMQDRRRKSLKLTSKGSKLMAKVLGRKA